MQDDIDLKRTTEICIEIAQRAGELELACFGHVTSSRKRDGSLVTEADCRAEELIRERLTHFFPEHAVYGEEFGMDGDTDNPWRWYIDPLDGTSNFVFGLPLWGVSIGLLYNLKPVAGVFHTPVIGDTFWAWHGGGAWLNGNSVSVSSQTKMSPNDLLCISSAESSTYQVPFPQKMRCFGSAAFELAATAAGLFVGLLHTNWHLHDMAAMLCMAQEAGAVVTDVSGQPFCDFIGLDSTLPGPPLLVAGPGLHAGLLNIIQQTGILST